MASFLVFTTLGWSYVLFTNNGTPVKWSLGSIAMPIMADNTTVLSDGTTQVGSIQAAMQAWNVQLGTVQFAPQIVAVGSGTDHNGANEIFFSGSAYGQAWDSNTLAITTVWYSGTTRTEADIIFNTAYSWDSYRGALRAAIDIRRVALHELGHVLGLSHPDLASPPQSVVAIMNSSASATDALQSDDIIGAQFLYGAPNAGPSITSQPSAQTVFAGQNVSFYTGANGSPAPTYQWQRLPAGGSTWANLTNDVTYAGCSTDTLTVSVPTVGMNSDQFRCVAANVAGSVTSEAATLTVNTSVAPTLLVLPTSLVLNYGETLYIGTLVSGTQPIMYLWDKDGVAIAGAFSSGYSRSAVTPTDSGLYTVTVSNYAGSASFSVPVTVNPAVAPSISALPATILVNPGDTLSISPVVMGSPPITYQWKKEGVAVPGATGSSYSKNNITAADGGSYTLTATNPGGTVTSTVVTVTVAGGSTMGVIAASAGNSHSLFIKSDGTVWAAGNNYYGQLGSGTTVDRPSPLQIATGVAAVSAGVEHSLFLKADGTLWAIGRNYYGELGDGTTTQRLSPVQVGTNVVAISAGYRFSLFIKSDGTLWGMGSNSSGQLGDGTFDDHHSPMLIATGVAAASAGGGFSLFIKSDRTLWAMGADHYGQLGNGTRISFGGVNNPVQIATNVLAASAGGIHGLFLKVDGSLWGMGSSGAGQIGAINGGIGPYAFSDTPRQMDVGVESIAAGGEHTLYIKFDKTLWGVGSNYYGGLGNETYATSYMTLTQIVTGVVATTAGSGFSLFVKADGSLWSMGRNDFGQLGNGTIYTPRGIPQQIASGPLAVSTAPTGVIGRGSADFQGTLLSFNPTLAATSYEVWRNTTNNSATATRIASNIPISLYYDLTADPNTAYYYWIKAVNPAGTSTFSTSGLMAPSNVTISITVE